ncbi:tRNA pseudouridine55 synthase [Nitratiruptor sp. YY08-26]|uniref:tRNA pseudouridine(55) synthase TruB n=1 Tax=unclassified Nitratiruptor TaxID=2624044 RepID=UPI001916C798|nr:MULTISPECIES: tRNA pseudouridine(55) synthase TruB [unclassified Nitratiruptor]BCD62756.1 tRNA pseudouridine55 synthase [Nitratiruptor sp. YY08-13]BCD66692.1 tRNA pseudouridine55 synthase [Nitratiruptor sp. YY08-26]
MNRLFVGYKPPFISSNAYLHQLKKKYRVKRAGFSGTLDPFACGTLIIAFGAYTKLFRFLKKYPKVYRATLWLGVSSESIDLENITAITTPLKVSCTAIEKILDSLHGTFTYTPPKFSAKKVGGTRAYKLAAKKQDVQLPQVSSTIYDIKLLQYNHPFVTFEATVSEGTYIRSIGEYIAKRLGQRGTLSYLERVREGAFIYEDEKPLDPLSYLNTQQNFTTLPAAAIWHGTKLSLHDLKYHENGIYHLVFDTFFTIISIQDGKIRYLLNQIPRSKA